MALAPAPIGVGQGTESRWNDVLGSDDTHRPDEDEAPRDPPPPAAFIGVGFEWLLPSPEALPFGATAEAAENDPPGPAVPVVAVAARFGRTALGGTELFPFNVPPGQPYIIITITRLPSKLTSNDLNRSSLPPISSSISIARKIVALIAVIGVARPIAMSLSRSSGVARRFHKFG